MKKLLLLLLFPLCVNAQYIKSFNSTGQKIVRYPELTVTNTLGNSGVEKSLLPNPDTIFASSVNIGSRYSFSLQLNVTSPLLSVGTLTLKVKLGGSTLTLANGVAIAGLGATTPIYIEGEVEIKGMQSQIVNARILQMNGVAIPVGGSSITPQADWTNDMTQVQYFDITATFTGVTLGTTSYKSRIFRRILE